MSAHFYKWTVCDEVQSTSSCVRLLCTNPPSGLIKIQISALHSVEKARLAQQLMCHARIMLQVS